MWTQDVRYGGTDGDVHINLLGDMCQTGWRELDHAFPYDDFKPGAGDDYSYITKDIGSQVK